MHYLTCCIKSNNINEVTCMGFLIVSLLWLAISYSLIDGVVECVVGFLCLIERGEDIAEENWDN